MPATSISSGELKTGVWQADEPFELNLPAEWNVTTYWPQTPPPLTDSAIAASLECPSVSRRCETCVAGNPSRW